MTTTTAIATSTPPSPGAGCSDNVMFSISSNSYPDGKLTCYNDKGIEIENKKEKEEKVEKEKEEEEVLSPGTTCIFLSSGHVNTGGFIIEMFCQDSQWKVTLTQL